MTVDNSDFSVGVVEVQIYFQVKSLLDKSGIEKLGTLENFDNNKSITRYITQNF